MNIRPNNPATDWAEFMIHKTLKIQANPATQSGKNTTEPRGWTRSCGRTIWPAHPSASCPPGSEPGSGFAVDRENFRQGRDRSLQGLDLGTHRRRIPARGVELLLLIERSLGHGFLQEVDIALQAHSCAAPWFFHGADFDARQHLGECRARNQHERHHGQSCFQHSLPFQAIGQAYHSADGCVAPIRDIDDDVSQHSGSCYVRHLVAPNFGRTFSSHFHHMHIQTIGVTGCGVAGLATALLLHRDGHRVTLFERFTAPQPLGSGLMIQATGLAVLRALQLDRDVLAAGARIDRLFGKAVPLVAPCSTCVMPRWMTPRSASAFIAPHCLMFSIKP